MRLTDEDRQILRTVWILVSAAVLLASYAVGDQARKGRRQRPGKV